MPKRKDLKRILVVGAGPIIIGQACEFDYSGTQACKALKDEGYKVILINSNPATIMTDPNVADKTYIEPITLKVLEKITEGIGAKSIDQVVYAWIVKHPSQIMPIVGSGKIDRIQTALDGLELELSMEQWYEIYNASTGVELP